MLSCLWVSAPVPCRDPSAPGPSTRTITSPHCGLFPGSSVCPPSPPSPGPSLTPSLASWRPTQRAVSNTSGPPLSGSSPWGFPTVSLRPSLSPLGGQRAVRTSHLPSHWPLCPKVMIHPRIATLGEVTPGHLHWAAFLGHAGSGPLCPPIAPGAALGPGCHCSDGVVTAVSLIARNSGRCECGPHLLLWLWLPDLVSVPADPWAALSRAAGQAPPKGQEVASPFHSFLAVASRMQGSCLLTKVKALSNGPSLVSGHLAESAGTSSQPLFRVTRSLENVAEGGRPTTGAIVLICRGRGRPRPIWTGQGA